VLAVSSWVYNLGLRLAFGVGEDVLDYLIYPSSLGMITHPPCLEDTTDLEPRQFNDTREIKTNSLYPKTHA